MTLKNRAHQMLPHLVGSCHLRLTKPSGFTVAVFVKPFANKVANNTCHDGDQKSDEDIHDATSFPLERVDSAPLYHKLTRFSSEISNKSSCQRGCFLYKLFVRPCFPSIVRRKDPRGCGVSRLW